jgi:hypothetical protein
VGLIALGRSAARSAAIEKAAEAVRATDPFRNVANPSANRISTKTLYEDGSGSLADKILDESALQAFEAIR